MKNVANIKKYFKTLARGGIIANIQNVPGKNCNAFLAEAGSCVLLSILLLAEFYYFVSFVEVDLKMRFQVYSDTSYI